MMGSFFTRILVMVFGYAYPAYECFKAVEKNKLDIEQLRFWCQYWILAAMLTVFERVMDIFISWIPMYSEAKLAFFIYLWFPKTKGTTYIYDSFFRPYLAKHEMEIDRSLLELRARFSDITVMYWQKAISFGQTRVFEILQYVATQSTAKPNPTQRGAVTEQPSTVIPKRQPAPTALDKPQKPPSRTTSKDRNKEEIQENDPAQEAIPPPVLPDPPAKEAVLDNPQQPPSRTLSTPARMTVSDQPTKEDSSQSKQVEVEEMQIEANEIGKAPPVETEMEETLRATRVRLRKTRSAVNH
ncbi:TB2/DP1/HVA22-related protein [Macleaya cordata]|uniref:HVA22-like protein n=1 Tax=Macleaya cordata TaxID=56857 RepID=A0A200R778_MACCD|nr:TB2/DP1/HVA22-related protein [Macleaya cordata]